MIKKLPYQVLFDQLITQQNGLCFYCNFKLPDTVSNADELHKILDHLLPIEHGGGNHSDNLCLAHADCKKLAFNMSLHGKLNLKETFKNETKNKKEE